MQILPPEPERVTSHHFPAPPRHSLGAGQLAAHALSARGLSHTPPLEAGGQRSHNKDFI